MITFDSEEPKRRLLREAKIRQIREGTNRIRHQRIGRSFVRKGGGG